jgi:hypothetical protein
VWGPARRGRAGRGEEGESPLLCKDRSGGEAQRRFARFTWGPALLPVPLLGPLASYLPCRDPNWVLPIRQIGGNSLNLPFAGEEKTITPVPLLFGVFITPQGGSAAVWTINGKQAQTSVCNVFCIKLVKKMSDLQHHCRQDRDR